jgi:CelD/BcsL family acetyltransferase involved in cellulose biosynthesis
VAVKASADQAPAAARGGAASAIASARRAALADRYPAGSLDVEWRSLADLHSIAAEWRELAARALEPNVFYEPAFALAAAPVFGHDVGVLLVWSGAAGPRKLLGFFPARIETRRYGIKLPLLIGWSFPYAPFGVPLIEREAAEPVIAAALAHLAGADNLPGLLLLPFISDSGPFATALQAIMHRAQMPAADFNRHRRALLAPDADRAHYLGRALSARRHKELRRISRRLADQGALMFSVATAPPDVSAAVDDFLAVEAGGWKGRAGTAAMGDEALGRFLHTAMAGLAADGKVAVNRILLDGEPIAAAIRLRSGRAAWFWKIAYDESFARFSPGVLLTLALTEELLDDGAIAHADSCATADHPMIDHIWRERLPLCDRLIGARPQAPFSSARYLEAMRSAAIAHAKAARDYFRR